MMNDLENDQTTKTIANLMKTASTVILDLAKAQRSEYFDGTMKVFDKSTDDSSEDLLVLQHIMNCYAITLDDLYHAGRSRANIESD